MNRAERAAVIAELVDRIRKQGGWSGATHLQKCLFFLQALGVPLGYDFTLYKHGPYSFDLRDELVDLQVAGVLELKVNPIPYGPSYIATDLSENLRSRISSVDEYNNQISFVAERLGNLGVTSLERLSTAQFVYQDDPSSSRDRQAQMVHELKPHISIDRAARAVDELRTLRTEAPAAATH